MDAAGDAGFEVSGAGGGAGAAGAGGLTCSGTVGVGLVGLSSVEGPSMTDFLDTSPTASSAWSCASSIGPCDRTLGIEP